MLVQNTLYDLNNVANLKDYASMDLILPILSENKDILENIDLEKYIKFDILPSNIQNRINEKL
jgi:hypothetical protein